MKIMLLLFLLLFPLQSFAKYPIEYPLTLNKIDRAAIHILDSINPISIKANIEFGGDIYIDHSYAIYVTNPRTDSNAHSVMIYPDTLNWMNRMKVANYHTHAAQNPDYLDETFSSTDTTKTRFKEYLATPMGKILKYDPRLGRMLILNRKTQRWEYYVFFDPDAEEVTPINPKLRLYDKIPPQILGQ
jgi:hypothetical protein